ncbi:DNA-directed RNA polymerase subunit omega [Oceanobacillus timonensis]|uniref:DNA-directed RNA polymerase subunit omega n=1 Tax=Oceanobacillus timonensis TaxID=1926285 RepID=UPI0009BA350D|nr:DNA-directed RNA polymerase subunit omega [Oceanobacillus timonensis]
MILEPSIDSLQKKIKSKYSLVTLSARRARELSETDDVLVEHSKSHKYLGKALEEIEAGKLYIKK